MVLLDKIYTRKGDKGTTSIGDGQRLSKTHQRLYAIGTVDELNSVLGMALVHSQNSQHAHEKEIQEQILNIQNDLFDLGADLAVPLTSEIPAIRMQEIQVDRLEREIDSMNSSLMPLNSFVIPGSNVVSTSLHMARTVCRRSEREILKLQEQEILNEALLKFVNRLSDHLFVMARFCIVNHCTENLWKPRKNQDKGL